LSLKEAEDKALESKNKQSKKEHGETEQGGPSCLIFLVIWVASTWGSFHYVGDLNWFKYLIIPVGCFIGSFLLVVILCTIFPFLNTSSKKTDTARKELPPEFEKQLNSMVVDKAKWGDEEWLFALALDDAVGLTEEFFKKGIKQFNRKFANVECSSLQESFWAVEFDGCLCQLHIMLAPMPEDFYAYSLNHCMFPQDQQKRFLNHKAFINLQFYSKSPNPKVRFLQAHALISCFQDSLSGILNSTTSSLFMPITTEIIKQNKLGELQPLCTTHIEELKKPDGSAWYVSRGNHLFGLPDFALLGPAGQAKETAEFMTALLNKLINNEETVTLGDIVTADEKNTFKTCPVHEYEEYIIFEKHAVLVLVTEEMAPLPDPLPELPEGASAEDRVIQKMSKWIQHPAEFSELPTEIQILRQEKTSWPGFDDDIDLYFLSFKISDGVERLAISGPIEWTFRGTNLSEFSEEEQKWIFAGWFMTWLVQNKHMPGKNPDEENDVLATKLVSGLGFGDILLHSKIDIQDGQIFYSTMGVKDDKQAFIIFQLNNFIDSFQVLDPEPWIGNELDALYYAIGKSLFNEAN
jgi:hypothetical protein